jgi:hypothetical protein
VLAQLDGTFRFPDKKASSPEMDSVKEDIDMEKKRDGNVASNANTLNGTAPPAKVPAKLSAAAAALLKPDAQEIAPPKSPGGTKRAREEDEESDGVPMEEDDDDDAMQMDESDSD